MSTLAKRLLVSPSPGTLGPEQLLEIARGPRREIRRRNTVQRGERRYHQRDMRRLIALAPMRHRRQVGTVGFGEQPIERYQLRDLAQLGGLRKRHDAGERNVESEVQRRARQRRAPREAVQDAADG